MAGSMRQIEVKNEYSTGRRKVLHPIFFSQEQFEKIKNSLADNVSCKVSGCYNNFCGGDLNANDEQNEILMNQSECTKVENGMCLYHQIKKKIHEEGGQQNTGNQTNTNSLTPEDIEHNRKVDEYQQKLSPDIEDNNFRETMNNFLTDANLGKFDEVDRDLVNKIRAKLYEEDRETSVVPTDDLFPISKIEVGDNADQK